MRFRSKPLIHRRHVHPRHHNVGGSAVGGGRKWGTNGGIFPGLRPVAVISFHMISGFYMSMAMLINEAYGQANARFYAARISV
jgi:hypothetical protein